MLYLAISGGVLLASFVVTLITTVKAKKTKKTAIMKDSENSTFLDRFKETLKKITTYSINAEKVFQSIGTGKFGNTKLEEVLNKIKVDCLANGNSYDEETWKSIINNLINFSKNVNKSN